MLIRGWSQRNNKDCFRSVTSELKLGTCSNDIIQICNTSFMRHSHVDLEVKSADSCNDAFLQRQCESDVEDTESKPASLLRRRLSSSS